MNGKTVKLAYVVDMVIMGESTYNECNLEAEWF